MGCSPPACCYCGSNPYAFVPSDAKAPPCVPWRSGVAEHEGAAIAAAPVQVSIGGGGPRGERGAADDEGPRNVGRSAPVAPLAPLPPSASAKASLTEARQGSLQQRPAAAPDVASRGRRADRDFKAESSSILSEGALVCGRLAHPWRDRSSHNQQAPVGQLGLTEAQRKALRRWCRSSELVREGSVSGLAIFAGPPSSSAIRQGLVGDCSLISALSALADHGQHFGGDVLGGIIHTREGDGCEQRTAASASGDYDCRLFFNGCMRAVPVDDQVPVGSAGQVLCSRSARENELWVMLLEKAIAAVMGGSYEMRGSNPGTDLFHLTGWIPENLELEPFRSDPLVGDALFARTIEGLSGGRCVVCVGTSAFDDAVACGELRAQGRLEGVSASTRLVAGHAYPVLAMRQVRRHRMLRLKNPWGRIRWCGRFCPEDPSWLEDPELAHSLGHDAASAELDDGCFWIELGLPSSGCGHNIPQQVG
mmetsp:Transcript_89937/g.288383  ORF Transcript_89937/g.288383 Transcript_89937/m.288383 type:complete len:478 (-) Transcript_89937:17-1450(-)